MKLDNFTTARCRECGWIKQFQPGKDYKAEDFICNCKEKSEKKKSVREVADELGITYKHNISDKKLMEKIEEATNGTES